MVPPAGGGGRKNGIFAGDSLSNSKTGSPVSKLTGVRSDMGDNEGRNVATPTATLIVAALF